MYNDACIHSGSIYVGLEDRSSFLHATHSTFPACEFGFFFLTVRQALSKRTPAELKCIHTCIIDMGNRGLLGKVLRIATQGSS